MRKNRRGKRSVLNRKIIVSKKIRSLIRSKKFPRYYILAAFVTLFATTIYWSVVGAIIQFSNADSLANIFLLGDGASRSMTLPAQHTFLLKLPLFAIVNAFGAEPGVFVIATVALCLLTVCGLAYILWRIEKRPLMLGTLLFALSAVLLFIPAQSYPGALLPANFAMLTTRNIEYVLFVGVLILVLRARSVRSPALVAAGLGLALLFASDRLFVALSAGTCVILGLIFLSLRRRDLLPYIYRFGTIIVGGYLIAAITVAWIALLGVTIHGENGPYGIVHDPKQLVIGIVYAGLGILTNLGANPAFTALEVKNIPGSFVAHLLGPVGLGYVVTLVIAFLALKALVLSPRLVPTEKNLARRGYPVWQDLLPIALLAATVAAIGLFVFSNHYYPVDSRYLTIVLFAAMIALARHYRSARIRPQRLLFLGSACLLAIFFGVLFQILNASDQSRALGEISRRNDTVAAALKSHPVPTLLGNYWRVVPIKLGSPTVTVTPLDGCTNIRQVLSSRAWQPDLHKTGFAYILRLDGGLAGFPTCTLSQVTDTYGRPDSSVVVAGTRSNPKEVLLFYDQGIHFLKEPAANNTPVDTVKPVSIDNIPYTTCPATTIMQFIAHEDDDILFMNPDMTHDIRAGNCIRTVYFTAGDAGSNKLYWLGRQQGAEEAYNTILGTPGAPWTERVVSIDGAHTITVANPRGNHRISLIFLHLPDGNPQGSGFASEHFESLRKLWARDIPAVHPVDDRSEGYSSGDLTSALTHLMTVYKPSQLRSQSTFAGATIKDHSDHNAVGEFAGLAYAAYKQTDPSATMTYYMGYPVHTLPANVGGEDYAQKVAAFLAFGKFDSATCHTLAECNNNAIYGLYLSRQYTYPY